MSEWQPISDEAKKLGPIVLTDGGYFIVGFWQEGRGWTAGWSVNGMSVLLELQPTHWMHLPEKPS